VFRRLLALSLVVAVVTGLLGVVAGSASAASPQTISSSPSPAYVGDSWTPTASGGGPLTATSTTTSICTATGGQVTFVAAGSCVVDLAAGASAEYDEVLERRTIAVTLVPVSLTVERVARATPTEDHYTFRVASVRGVPTGYIWYSFAGVNSSVTLSNGTGTLPRSALGAGVSTTLQSAQYVADLNSRWDTTIIRNRTWTEPNRLSATPQPAYVGDTWTPTASGGNAVTVTSSTAGVCSVAGGTVSLLAPGDCVVDLSAGAVGNAPAVSERRTVEVTKIPVTLAVTLAPVDADRLKVTVKITTPRGAPAGGVALTVGDRTLAETDLVDGTATWTEPIAVPSSLKLAWAAEFTPSAARWAGAEETGESEVPLFPQDVTIQDVPALGALGETWTPVFGWAGTGLPTSWTATGACSRDGVLVRFDAVGTCRVIAVQDAGYPYAEGRAQVRVPVGLAQTVSASPTPAYVGDSWTPTASDGGEVTTLSTTPTVCTVTDGVVSFRAAGSCIVDLEVEGHDEHAPAWERRTIVVTLVPVTVGLEFAPYDGFWQTRIILTATSPRGAPQGTIRNFLRGYGGGTARTLADGRAEYDMQMDYYPGGDYIATLTYTPPASSRWAPTTTEIRGVFPRVPQTTSISGPSSVSRVGGTWAPAITWKQYGGAQSWTATGACSRDEDVVRFDSVGDCTVTAIQEQTNDYAEGRATVTFAVRKPLATFSDNPDPAYVGDTWNPTSTGDGDVTATSTTPAVCTTDGGTVRFVAAGDCVVDLAATETDDHDAATEQRTIAVALVPVKLTVELTSLTPGLLNVAVKATSPRGTPTGTIQGRVEDASASEHPLDADGVRKFIAVNVGDIGLPVAIRAGYRPTAGSRWAPATLDTDVVVPKVVQPVSISAPPSGARVGGSWQPVIAWAEGGPRPTSWSVAGGCERDGAAVRFTAAGTCTVTAVQEGDDSYAEGRATRDFTVARGAQTVGLDTPAPTAAHVGDTWVPSVTGGASGEPVALDAGPAQVCTVDAGTVRFIGHGECEVSFSQDGDTDYEAAETAVTIQVARVPVTVTLTPGKDLTVGVPAELTVATTAGGDTVPGQVTVKGAGVEVDGPVTNGPATLPVTFPHAGSQELVVTFEPDDPNTYADYDGDAEVAVARGTQTIALATPAPATARAGDTWNPGATGGASGSATQVAAAPADVCVVEGASVRFVGHGTCEVVVTQDGSDDYEPASDLRRTVAVERRSSAVTLDLPPAATVGEPAIVTARAADGGTVLFTFGGKPVGGPVTVANGSASVELLPTRAGHEDVTATFTPAAPGAIDSAEATASLVVGRAPTTTVLVIGAEGLRATVASERDAAGTPTGDVVFAAGERVLGRVTLDDGVAELAQPLEPTWQGQVTASYDGDGDRRSSTASVRRVLPSVVGTVRATRPPLGGWYDAAVVVVFTCTPGSAPLVGGCPAPVTLGEGRGQSVTRTVTAADGGKAQATVAGISVDVSAPVVAVRGVVTGRVYKGSAPAACRASDSGSGLASCRLTQRRAAHGVWVVTARAVDRAGHAATATVRYRAARVWERYQDAGLPISVRPGQRVWLAVLSTGPAPRVTGSFGRSSLMRLAGTTRGGDRWHVAVPVPGTARHGSTYVVRVRAGGTREVVRLHVK
jgi:hypothetical protein